MNTVTDILASKNNDPWAMGGEQQQVGALLAEQFIFNSEISAQSDDVVAEVLYALKDVQVRDYVMGLTDTVDSKHVIGALNWLISKAPEGYKAAPASILSIVYYEKDEVKLAFESVRFAHSDTPDYALAALLNRVYSAGMSAHAFKILREELHPKVTAGIFGEAQYDNSN